MPTSEHRKEYEYTYKKEHWKRVPLDLEKSKYFEVKAAADSCHESVNGFIKVAINERLKNLEQDKQEKE